MSLLAPGPSEDALILGSSMMSIPSRCLKHTTVTAAAAEYNNDDDNDDDDDDGGDDDEAMHLSAGQVCLLSVFLSLCATNYGE